MDKWDGYPADRDRLMTFLHDRRPSNPVVVTGDLHTNWVNDLKLDFERPASPTVGTEFAGTSISSSGDGVDMAPQGENALAHNPHIKFFNAQRGYVRCRVTPDRLQADFRVMPYVTRPDAPIATRASYVVENGTPRRPGNLNPPPGVLRMEPARRPTLRPHGTVARRSSSGPVAQPG